MFIKETYATNETYFQETYASAARSDEAIQNELMALTDDFSLSEETVGDFETTDWSRHERNRVLLPCDRWS